MNVGIYQGTSALSALERWQTTISENIAASSVPGFRKDETSVEGLNYGTIQDRTGVRSSTQPAVMPQDNTRVSFESGSITRTANPTDFAIQGKGFFAVQDPSGKAVYTRNGQFSTNSSNQLVTANGALVQGLGGPIQLLPTVSEIHVDQAGQIYQDNQLMGKLKVVEFSDLNTLSKVSGGFVAQDDGAAKVVANPNISQGYIEGSNVSAMQEMIKLIQVTHAQEANQKAITSYDNRLAKVIQTFTK